MMSVSVCIWVGDATHINPLHAFARIAFHRWICGFPRHVIQESGVEMLWLDVFHDGCCKKRRGDGAVQGDLRCLASWSDWKDECDHEKIQSREETDCGMKRNSTRNANTADERINGVKE